MPWKPPRISRLFHNYPHLSGNLRRVNNTFDIDSPVYVKSITTGFFIHLLWLLIVLVILLVYLHHRLYTFRHSHPIKLSKLLRLVRLLIRICICLAIGSLILEVIMHILIVWKLHVDPDKLSFSTRVIQNQEKTKDILLEEYARYLETQQRKLEATFPGYSYLTSTYGNFDRHGGRYISDYNFKMYSNPRYTARFYFEANNLRLLTLRKMRNADIITSTAIMKEKNNPIEPLIQNERGRFITFFMLWTVAIVLLFLLERHKGQIKLLWMGVLLTLVFMCLLLGALCAEGMIMGDACQEPLALKKYTKGKAKMTVESGCIEYCKEMDFYIQRVIRDYTTLFKKSLKKENLDKAVYTNDEEVIRLSESLGNNRTRIDRNKYFDIGTNENFTKFCPKTDHSIVMSYDTDGALRSFCVGDVILEHVFVQCMAAMLINAMLIIILLIFIYTRDYILPYDPVDIVPMSMAQRIGKFLTWLTTSSHGTSSHHSLNRAGTSSRSRIRHVKSKKSLKKSKSSSECAARTKSSRLRKRSADKFKITGKPSTVKGPPKFPCVNRSKLPLKGTPSKQSPCQILCPVKVESNPQKGHHKSGVPITKEDLSELHNSVRSPKHRSPRKEENSKANKPLPLQTQNTELTNRRPGTKQSNSPPKQERPPKSKTKPEHSPKPDQTKYRHVREKMQAYSSVISSHKYRPRTVSNSLKSERHQKTTSYSKYQTSLANSRRKSSSSSSKQAKETIRKLIPSSTDKHKIASSENAVVVKLKPVPPRPTSGAQRKTTSRTRSTKQPSHKKLSELVMRLKVSETLSALSSEAELSCTEFLDIAEVRAPSPQDRSKPRRY